MAVAVMTSASCTKWLEENPTTQMMEPTIYKSEASAKAALTGIYGNYSQSQYGNWSRHTIGNNCILMGGATPNNIVGVNSHDTAPYGTAYRLIYNVISDCNVALACLESSSLSQKVIDHISGEIKFIRGFLYFDLVRHWGRVPLVLKTPQTMEDVHTPRAAIKDLLDQSLADFSDAFDLMPDRDEQLIGRPHKWAAKAMLAKVYVYMACIKQEHFRKNATEFDTPYTLEEQKEFWQEAYDHAKAVYDEHCYELLECYEDLFFRKEGSQNSKEAIFELQYNGSSTNTTNGAIIRTVSSTTEMCPYNGTGNWNNAGNHRVGPLVFMRHWLRHGYLDSNREVVPLRIAFSSTSPPKPLSNKMEGVDPRINIAYVYYNLRTVTNNDMGNFVSYGNQNIFPNMAGAAGNWYWIPTKKYYYPEMNGRGEANIFIFRYAELLLMLAEITNELDDSPARKEEAIGYLDQVIRRAKKYRNGGMMYAISSANWVSGTIPEAYGNVYTNPFATVIDDPNDERPPLLYMDKYLSGKEWLDSQDTLRMRIMEERLFEFCNESGEEGFDVRRRGFDYMKVIVERNNQLNSIIRNTPANGGWGSNVGSAIIVTYDPNDEIFMHRFLRYPIPPSEYNYNTAIVSDQNYGY